MAKAVLFKFRCTVCNEVFQNDYVGKHTKPGHKGLHASDRLAPKTIVLDTSDTHQSKMDAFFHSPPVDDSNSSSAKKREIDTNAEGTKLSEPEDGDTPTDQGKSSAQKVPILSEQQKKGDMPEESEGTSSTGEMSDDADPAGLGI